MNIRIFLSFILALCLLHIPPSFSTPLSTREQTIGLLKQGGDYQQKGFYLDARAAYQQAYQLALKSNDLEELALSQTALGFSEYLLNHFDKAQLLLQEAYGYAASNHDIGLLALTLYYLGLLNQAQQNNEQAQTLLLQSLPNAEKLGEALLVSRIHIALANSAATWEALFAHQQQAVLSLKKIQQANVTGELYLLLVEQGLDNPLSPKLTVKSDTLLQGSKVKQPSANQHLAYLYKLLQLAQQNIEIKNQRQQAKYHVLKARLYESRQRYSEALQLTQQAIQLLQAEKAQDLLMFYEWQAGHLYKVLHKNELAIASYRRAISYVQTIRQDIPISYQNGKSSFLELFGPLYRGLIELLLQQARNTEDIKIKNIYLSEVQVILERLKQTELEDFFKDRCLLSAIDTNKFIIKDNKVAVLYPIVLTDHIEILLHIGEQFYQYTASVSTEDFEKLIRSYAAKLRKGSTADTNRKLYDWLVRPMLQQLKEHQIETLVYIPDGALRLLPLAVLHDGQRYLIEDYAISTIPGLAILPTEKVKHATEKTLLVGLSKPGIETVASLPDSLLQSLLAGDDSTENDRGLAITGNIRSVANKLRELKMQGVQVSRKTELEYLAQALSLPGVQQEIELLAKSLPSHSIINQDFTLNNFDHLAEQPEYDTIHIASHGFFGGTSNESYIMTYDRLLTIDHLESLLTERGIHDPIDLLVLSACQTAEGDDRAPLGLSGIALKARARTALGSLWPISDLASVEIMQAFYLGLKQQGLSKAKALQQAQIKLINSEELSDPFYWSPFVLVGHWQ